MSVITNPENGIEDRLLNRLRPNALMLSPFQRRATGRGEANTTPIQGFAGRTKVQPAPKVKTKNQTNQATTEAREQE